MARNVRASITHNYQDRKQVMQAPHSEILPRQSKKKYSITSIPHIKKTKNMMYPGEIFSEISSLAAPPCPFEFACNKSDIKVLIYSTMKGKLPVATPVYIPFVLPVRICVPRRQGHYLLCQSCCHLFRQILPQFDLHQDQVF